MINAIAGQKREMTQDFLKSGVVVPLTVIEARPGFILQIKDSQKDGYEALKIAFGQGKGKYNKKPLLGEIKKAGGKKMPPPAFVVEIRGHFPEQKLGGEVNLGKIIKVGDWVQVSGNAKGKGFAGAMKRWGFHGGPATHGQSDRPRAVGAIGQRSTPGRVYKGKKMPGRMGGQKVTVRNLKVFKVDKEKNLLYVQGAVPGARGSWLVIKKIKSQK